MKIWLSSSKFRIAFSIYIVTMLFFIQIPAEDLVEKNITDKEKLILITENTYDQIDQQQTQGRYGWGFGSYDEHCFKCNTSAIAQSFEPTYNKITRLKVKLSYLLDNYTIFFKIAIRDDRNGQDLTSMFTFYDSSINERWMTYDLPDISVIPGNKYYIYYEASDAPACFMESHYGSNNPYSKGEFFIKKRVGGWVVQDTFDMAFIVYGLQEEDDMNKPKSRFIFTPLRPDINEEIQFDGSLSYDPDGGSIVEYAWDFNDDDSYDAFGRSVTWSFPNKDIYPVELTVTDDEYDTDTEEKNVVVGEWNNNSNYPPNVPNIPTGPSFLEPKEIQEFCSQTKDLEGDKIYFQFDWEANSNHNFSNWKEINESGIFCDIHQWNYSGIYQIKARAKDSNGNMSNWSKALNITVNQSNKKPNKPVFDGPFEGRIGNEYTYSVTAHDPDGDQLYYLFNFSEEPLKKINRLYDSGEVSYINHTWNETGDYIIKVKAIDIYETESDWSNPFFLTMAKSNNNVFPWLRLFFDRIFHCIPWIEDFFQISH